MISARNHVEIAVKDHTIDTPDESDDEDSAEVGDDVNEMRAFMHMFMDLVGMFSEDQEDSKKSKGSDGRSYLIICF